MSYFSFCPTLEKIIETGESKDGEGKEISVNGLSSINNLKILREIIFKERCHHTLEIGLAYGGSALAMLSSLKE